METLKRTRRRRRRKDCQCCGELFDPDPRTQGKQKYCSKESCQSYRQRQNEYRWLADNSDGLAYQQELTKRWYKAHPEYSRERRKNDPKLARRNVELTRERMRRKRRDVLFDKNKSIFTQLLGNNTDKCYLSKGSKWLIARLTKASPFTKVDLLTYNPEVISWKANRLPKGRLHDISAVF
jgi:hypothetical protein